MIGGVYKITNKLNGKIYIGQSIRPLTRWKEHQYSSINATDRSYDYPIHKAMRKYGIDNFSFEIIESIEENSQKALVDKLHKLEIYYIGFYDSYNKGYNATHGGDGHYGLRGEQSPNWGKTASQETKDKMSRSQKAREDLNRKPVLQFDLQNNFIKEWICLMEIERVLKIPATNISKVCKGKRNKAGGFKWKFKEGN